MNIISLKYSEPSTHIGANQYLPGSIIITFAFIGRLSRKISYAELEYPYTKWDELDPNDTVRTAISCMLANKWAIPPEVNSDLSSLLFERGMFVQNRLVNTIGAYSLYDALYVVNACRELQALFIVLAGEEYDIEVCTLENKDKYIPSDVLQMRCWRPETVKYKED